MSYSNSDKYLNYIPEDPTSAQVQAIQEIANPRALLNFSFSYEYKEVPTDDVSLEELMTFVNGITPSLARAV